MGICCKLPFYSCLVIFTICIFFSCSVERNTSVKNYPADTAFVFNNKVIIKGKLTNDEKKKLVNGLGGYWADSLYALRSNQIGISLRTAPFLWTYRLTSPPIFDSTNIPRTISYMTGYLKSQGYFYGQMQDTTLSSQFHGQKRKTIIMTVEPGVPTIIDSEGYSIETARLQALADSSKKSSIIQPGKSPLSKDLIGGELDRLVKLYRENGYFLLSRDNLIAEVDTLDQSLLNVSTDPFEQAQKISEAVEKKKQNPTAIVTIKQRENTDSIQTLPDSMHFKTYKVGKVYFFPEADVRLPADSVMNDTVNIKTATSGDYEMYYRKGLFRLRPLMKIAKMRTGVLYNDGVLSRAITNFNQLPAWNLVDYRALIRGDSIVDFYFLLSPAPPENVSPSLEMSRNTGDFLTTGTLFGTALNTSYTNRNLFKSAVQWTASFSNGVELSFDPNYPLLQTFISSLSNTFTFPNSNVFFTQKLGLAKVNISANYSQRYDFFRVRSLVTNFGWEWRTKKNWVWQVRPINIELYSLDTLPLLDSAFKQTPYLRTSFNTGAVLSTQASVTQTVPGRVNPANTFYWRAAAELAPFGYKQYLYKFGKVEAEIRKQWAISRKTQLAFRAFGGVGYNFSSDPVFGATLPFYKQFVAGGPNSMRAWGLRELGLGSSVISDTASFRERYGDMQLETNLEYRFPITAIGSVNISSAFFVDAGNIWDIKKAPNVPTDGEFDISRLGKDIAIGAGTGLRFDFNYFLIRLDFGLKVKDPARYDNSGWISLRNFTWQNKEYGTTNPTTGVISPLPRDNYAVQLGIGLPF